MPKYNVIVYFLVDPGPFRLTKYARSNVEAETGDDAIDQVLEMAKQEYPDKAFLPIKAYAVDAEKVFALSVV